MGEMNAKQSTSDIDKSPQTNGELQRHGPWHIKASAVMYEDPWVSVRRDEVVRPDGLDGSYAIVAIKPGVCVVAIDDHGNVHLTEEFHYAVGRVTIEGVSGGIEPGHTATETAHRELAEELGITARHLLPLGVTDPFTASVHSPTALFVATGIKTGTAAPEPTELIRPVVMSLENAVQAVNAGEITHGPTCIILLRMAIQRAALAIK
jgi:ADP-ribose pyrophosphatase